MIQKYEIMKESIELQTGNSYQQQLCNWYKIHDKLSLYTRLAKFVKCHMLFQSPNRIESHLSVSFTTCIDNTVADPGFVKREGRKSKLCQAWKMRSRGGGGGDFFFCVIDIIG